MRHSIATLALALLCSLCTAAEDASAMPHPPIGTHQEVARKLVLLLQDTNACLASCVDAATVQAALPRLRELAARAEDIKAEQTRLPDPTRQDYSVGPDLAAAFSSTWKSIRDHIARLEEAHLVSPELRDILRIAPPEPSASAE